MSRKLYGVGDKKKGAKINRLELYTITNGRSLVSEYHG